MNPIFDTEQFIQFVSLSFKLLMTIGVLVYGLFALLMTRQVSLMIRTLTTKHENSIKLLTYLHLGMVVLFLIIVLVWL